MPYSQFRRSAVVVLSCALGLVGCAKVGGSNNGSRDLGQASGPDVDLAVNSDGPVNTDPISDPLASAYKETRGVVHMHSVYSHDACDGAGIPGGVRNMSCWNDLRAAVCSTGLQFVSLNDHPAHMNEYSMNDEMLFDGAQGDTAIMEAGTTVGNQLKCPDGHTVIVTEGFENDHALPIAFSNQPVTTGKAYGTFDNANSMADMQAMVAELKAAGAVMASAHSEEDAVSAQTLLDVGVDAMEWYNPHGNFLTVMGAGDGIGLGALDALNLLGDMSPFLAGSSSGAHPDLVLMLLLPKWPQKGFDKWREVQRTRTVTGLLGSDVHQNVSVKPLCTGAAQIACALAAQGSSGKTQALALLAAGGLIVMSDGRRLDAYERIMRWLENRMLVSDVSIAGIKDALRAGRSYGLFSVFGSPEGFRFVGQANGQVLEMGGAAKGPIALTARLPKSAQPQGGGATWSAADSTKVELHASLFYTSATETTLVKESRVLGDTVTFTATQPGAYHVEVWQKPKHLVTALGSAASYADTEYLWVISNPIRVLP
jgi:hypothetical protein